jgi:hypothetical protein
MTCMFWRLGFVGLLGSIWCFEASRMVRILFLGYGRVHYASGRVCWLMIIIPQSYKNLSYHCAVVPLYEAEIQLTDNLPLYCNQLVVW